MMEHKTWMQWAIELQSLAQAGLAYGKDSYDKERYIRIREISAEIISHMSVLGRFREAGAMWISR